MEKLQKGEKKTFGGIDALKAALSWQTDDDFDLSAVYESNDGARGLIYFGELGSLGSFPYMLLIGDEGADDSGSVQTETLHISKMSELKQVWILCWDYDKINQGIPAAFEDSGAGLSISGETGDAVDIPASIDGPGNVLRLATITNAPREGVVVQNTPKTGILKGLHNFDELTVFLEI